MRTWYAYLLFALLIAVSVGSIAQERLTDSLQNVLNIPIEDTVKVNVLNKLFLEYEFSDVQKAEGYLKEAIRLSEKADYKKGLAKAYKHSGFLAEDKENYPEALKNYFASLEVYEEIGDQDGVAANYNGIGTIYFFQKNYDDALKNYLAGLEIYEKMKIKNGLAITYNNIGNVNTALGNYPEALKYLSASLKMEMEQKDTIGISYSYNNIGNVYENIARAEKDMAMADLAIKTHLEALKYRKGRFERASSFGNIGRTYLLKKEYVPAREYLLKAIALSKESRQKLVLKNAYKALTELDSSKGDYRNAYEDHKLYILYRDSLDNEATRKKTIQVQMTYDFEKKEAVAEAEHKKEMESQQLIAGEKSRKQAIIILFVSGSLLLVLVFAGFVFRSLRLTRKQKDIIELQKNMVEEQKREVEEQKIIVEEHQKSIIDSITYARRIQRSLLPTEKYIQKNLNRLKK